MQQVDNGEAIGRLAVRVMVGQHHRCLERLMHGGAGNGDDPGLKRPDWVREEQRQNEPERTIDSHDLSLSPFYVSEEHCLASGGKILTMTLAMTAYNQISTKHTVLSAWRRARGRQAQTQHRLKGRARQVNTGAAARLFNVR